MSDFISDNDVIYTDETGTVRVRVVHDPEGPEPDNDGAMPTLRLDTDYYRGVSTVRHVAGSEDYGFDAEDVWSRLSEGRGWRETLAVFKRYARIFHGATTFHEYNIGISREYGYLTFDTMAWWEAMGRRDVSRLLSPDARALLGALDEYPAYADQLIGRMVTSGYPRIEGQRLSTALDLLIGARLAEHVVRPVYGSGYVRKDGAEQSFEEYKAWIVGEVYGLVLEHKVRRHMTTEDLADPTRPCEETVDEEWVEEDSIWGIYGSDLDNALDVARGNLLPPTITPPDSAGDVAA